MLQGTGFGPSNTREQEACCRGQGLKVWGGAAWRCAPTHLEAVEGLQRIMQEDAPEHGHVHRQQVVPVLGTARKAHGVAGTGRDLGGRLGNGGGGEAGKWVGAGAAGDLRGGY